MVHKDLHVQKGVNFIFKDNLKNKCIYKCLKVFTD